MNKLACRRHQTLCFIDIWIYNVIYKHKYVKIIGIITLNSRKKPYEIGMTIARLVEVSEAIRVRTRTESRGERPKPSVSHCLCELLAVQDDALFTFFFFFFKISLCTRFLPLTGNQELVRFAYNYLVLDITLKSPGYVFLLMPK